MGDCYRLPEEEEEANEVLYRQLEVAAQSQALVLVENSNHLDICWRNHTVRQKQPRKFLESIDNFLTRVVKEPTRKGVQLDLILPNMEGMVRDVKAGGSLGYSDHEIMELSIL